VQYFHIYFSLFTYYSHASGTPCPENKLPSRLVDLHIYLCI